MMQLAVDDSHGLGSPDYLPGQNLILWQLAPVLVRQVRKRPIRNNMKIGEAYLLFGFKDYSGFYKAFRKEYGMSPKEWQETVMNIPEF